MLKEASGQLFRFHNGLFGKHTLRARVHLLRCLPVHCDGVSTARVCVCVCMCVCGHTPFDIRDDTEKLHVCLSSVNEPWERSESRLRKDRNNIGDACDLSHVTVGNGHVASICTSALFTRCGKDPEMTDVCQISRLWERGLLRVQALNI